MGKILGMAEPHNRHYLITLSALASEKRSTPIVVAEIHCFPIGFQFAAPFEVMIPSTWRKDLFLALCVKMTEYSHISQANK